MNTLFKAIGFDYTGVIAGPNDFNQKVEKILDINKEARRAAYLKFNHLLNNGLISREELWKKVLGELNLLEKYDELIKYINDPLHYKIHNNIITLINVLKNKGYKTGMLSNNSIKEAEIIRSIGLNKYFDTIIVSAEVGCSKPDPEIFQIFCKQLQVKLNELIFIDDSPGNIAVAGKLGCKAILYQGYESLIKNLKDLNIKL